MKERTGLFLEIEACGVCRSNLHLIEGDWKKYGAPSSLPVIPGDEVVGIVKKIGDGVKKVEVGDRGRHPAAFSAHACSASIVCHGGRTLCETLR